MEEEECPECGSADIDINPDITESEWQCLECGHKFDLDDDE